MGYELPAAFPLHSRRLAYLGFKNGLILIILRTIWTFTETSVVVETSFLDSCWFLSHWLYLNYNQGCICIGYMWNPTENYTKCETKYQRHLRSSFLFFYSIMARSLLGNTVIWIERIRLGEIAIASNFERPSCDFAIVFDDTIYSIVWPFLLIVPFIHSRHGVRMVIHRKYVILCADVRIAHRIDTLLCMLFTLKINKSSMDSVSTAGLFVCSMRLSYVPEFIFYIHG